MNELALIALETADNLGQRVDQILSDWYGGEHFRIPVWCPRFVSGEGKGYDWRFRQRQRSVHPG